MTHRYVQQSCHVVAIDTNTQLSLRRSSRRRVVQITGISPRPPWKIALNPSVKRTILHILTVMAINTAKPTLHIPDLDSD